MTVTISAALMLGTGVVILCRYAGLRIWHAAVCVAAAGNYAPYRPRLDDVSRQGIDSASRPQAPSCGYAHANSQATAGAAEQADDPLWLALCTAPEDGTDVAELMRITGWKRTKLYRHLREHAEAGRAMPVSGGRWRARTPEERSP